MAYSGLRECIDDLKANQHLITLEQEVATYLEFAEIQRRVYEAGGPAILYNQVKGSSFPAVSNIFGTLERTKFIFRDTFETVRRAFEVKADPSLLLKKPLNYLKLPLLAWNALPKKVKEAGVRAHTTEIDQLPQIHSWPQDGGAFITLPQVFTENPENPKIFQSNMGMYRIQLSGGQYQANKEIGMHYQLHRGIGNHHQKAIRRGEKLRVSIFVGGPPSHTLAAVMPLPEGLSELMFAGALGGKHFEYQRSGGHFISAQADFCITGWIDPKRTLPEGPFGDHLGYYSLAHDFPVVEVDQVFHREGAIWPFTIVGRPPQEDTSFGAVIHELTGDLLPKEIPGVKALKAVDAAGVHPLMIAIGSERYVPYEDRKPRELLTTAHAILGYGQCSLAKYLFITAREDDEGLDLENSEKYFAHVLERVRWEEDLHFQTRTTIDTLDYSGEGLNEGSKLVIAAAGTPRRTLGKKVPSEVTLPSEFKSLKVVMPGVLAVKGPEYKTVRQAQKEQKTLCTHLKPFEGLKNFPLIVLTDDSQFTARTLNNFLWVTFTRSNPAWDINGVGSFTKNKHWGCTGSLVIDARSKPHHAPLLETDPQVVKKVDELGAKGGPLHGVI